MQKLTVLFNTGRETLLDISKLPPPKHHEGSTFVESKIIPLDEIYISLKLKLEAFPRWARYQHTAKIL